MDIGQALEEIKSRLDIVEIISEHLDLRRSGSNYKALCPFHNEKTPSFMVSPDKQIFHCFGCGTGGDLVTFVMKYEGLPFVDAVKTLASRAGISIDDNYRTSHGKGGVSRDELIRVHEVAAEHFAKELQKDRRALKYLKDRGIRDETIRTFSLGFAPPGRDRLLNLLKEKGFPEATILRAGLCKEAEQGKTDTFRNRVIFPITNLNGNIIAFGGRSIQKDFPGPKYLNSPETPIFHKSSSLFGLHLARKEIVRKGYAILMEGYLDVITAFQSGIKNVLAPLGTSLTEGQTRRLRTITRKVLLVFDSDEAGIKATRRGLHILYKEGITGKVMLLPSGEDPDSFIRERGAGAFKALFPQSRGLVDFFLSLSEERVDIIREILFIISTITDAILRGELIRELAEKADLPEPFLREELSSIRKSPARESASIPVTMETPESHLLGIYLAYPESRPLINESLNTEDIPTPLYRSIFEKIRDLSFEEISQLEGHLTGEEFSTVTSTLMKCDIDKGEIERNIHDSISRLEATKRRKKIKEIEAGLRLAEKTGDEEKLEKLKVQLDNLIKEGIS